MIGVVLCGGQSTRMGSDKGLLKYDTTTWAQNTVAKLQALSFPVIVSINVRQLADYSKIFTAKDLITDNNLLDIKGPLCGVLSTHLQYPSEDFLVLACDMPLMEKEILKELVVQYHLHPNDEAFVFTNDGEPEPLCGIYKANGLAHIHHLYQTGQLPKHSMKYMLENITPFLIPLPDDKKKYFSNFNTHAELNGL